MSDQISTDEKLIAAFELMWQNYPGPVTLVARDKTILAANPAALAIGRQPGVNCAQLPPAESHKGCLANQALADHQPRWLVKEVMGTMKTIYWIPVDGYPDVYIHFSAGEKEL